MNDLNEKLNSMEAALESAARAFGKHSGPSSDERERDTFSRDLRDTALRYARAYYDVAKAYGLFPVFHTSPTALDREADETERIRAAVQDVVESADRPTTSDPRDLTDDELQREWEIEEPRHEDWPGRRMIIEIRRQRALRSELRNMLSEATDHAGEVVALMTCLARLIGAKP